MELRNKPPHWNESLRCWCLNFRGRVKLASVKNFQLIASTDPTKTIVMQASLPTKLCCLWNAPDCGGITESTSTAISFGRPGCSCAVHYSSNNLLWVHLPVPCTALPLWWAGGAMA